MKQPVMFTRAKLLKKAAETEEEEGGRRERQRKVETEKE
jgi:hypothetical protein